MDPTLSVIAKNSHLVDELLAACKKQLGYKNDPKIVFLTSCSNAANPLGKTGYYLPQEQKIAIYVTERHIKDVLRSLAHELVHHAQNERGEFENAGMTEEGYAQKDDHLREMEREAYEKGNLAFRDFEDLKKGGKMKKQQIKEAPADNWLELQDREHRLIGKRIREIVRTYEEMMRIVKSERGRPSTNPHQEEFDKLYRLVQNFAAWLRKKQMMQENKGGKMKKQQIKEAVKKALRKVLTEKVDYDKIKNPGKYKLDKWDKDGDGVPNGADEAPKDGDIQEAGDKEAKAKGRKVAPEPKGKQTTKGEKAAAKKVTKKASRAKGKKQSKELDETEMIDNSAHQKKVQGEVKDDEPKTFKEEKERWIPAEKEHLRENKMRLNEELRKWALGGKK